MAKGVKFNPTGTEEYMVILGNHGLYVSDEGGGPSSGSGIYALPDIPSGGYVIIGPTSTVRTAANDSELLAIGADLGLPSSSVYSLIDSTLTNDNITVLGDKDIVSGDNTLAYSGIGHYVKYNKDEFVIRVTGQEEPSFFTFNSKDKYQWKHIGSQMYVHSIYAWEKMGSGLSDADALNAVLSSYGDSSGITGLNYRIVWPAESIDSIKLNMTYDQKAAYLEQNFWMWPAFASAMRESNWFTIAKSQLPAEAKFELLNKKMMYKVGLPLASMVVDWGDGTTSEANESTTHYYEHPGPWITKLTTSNSSVDLYGAVPDLPFYPPVGEVVYGCVDILSFGNYSIFGGVIAIDGFPLAGSNVQLEAFRNMKLANEANAAMDLEIFNSNPSIVDQYAQAFLDMTSNPANIPYGVQWTSVMNFPYANDPSLNEQVEMRKDVLRDAFYWSIQ